MNIINHLPSASDTEDICDEMGKVLKLYDQLMDGRLSDRAEEVGCKLLKSMEGNDVVGYTFKKKGQVATMDHDCSVKVDGEGIQVDL